MNGPHFKEIIESICLSTHSTKKEVAEELFVSTHSIWNWETKGVPEFKTPYVMDKLKEYLFRRIS